MTDDSWAVAVTGSQQERTALKHVERQGHTCWLPQFKDVIVQHGCARTKVSPLFPRYLFVLVQGAWRSLLGTRGVVGLIMNDNHPSLLKNEVIERIRQECDDDGCLILPKPKSLQPLQPGQPVTPRSGHFLYSIGVYQGTTAQHREIALFSLFGRQTRVEFKRGELVAA